MYSLYNHPLIINRLLTWRSVAPLALLTESPTPYFTPMGDGWHEGWGWGKATLTTLLIAGPAQNPPLNLIPTRGAEYAHLITASPHGLENLTASLTTMYDPQSAGINVHHLNETNFSMLA